MSLTNYWAFDGDNGADSVGTYTLSKTGTASAVADSPILGQDNSLSLAGAGRYTLASPAGLSFSNDISIGAWVKWSSLNTGIPVAISTDDNANYWLIQLRSGKIAVRCEIGGINRSINSTVTAVADTWYWVSYSLDASNDAVLYVNAVNSGNNTDNLGDVTAGFGATPYIVVGAKDSAGTSSFSGQIAGVYWRDEALDATGTTAAYLAATQASTNLRFALNPSSLVGLLSYALDLPLTENLTNG